MLEHPFTEEQQAVESPRPEGAPETPSPDGPETVQCPERPTSQANERYTNTLQLRRSTIIICMDTIGTLMD